eukprot:g17802.t1
MDSVLGRLKEKFRTEERCAEQSCSDEAPAGLDQSTKAYPPTRSQIGRAAWRYLHTMAANCDQHPPPEKQRSLQEWFVSFVQFYPCSHCAESFIDIVAEKQPDFSSRENYARWWSWAHNRVRDDLSQPRLIDPGKEQEFARLLQLTKEGKQWT